MRPAQGLLIGVFIVLALTMVIFTPDHGVESGWTTHATVHLLQGIFWLVGLCIVGIVLTVLPLGRGEMWAWWMLLFLGIIIFGGYFMPALLVNGQEVRVVEIAGEALMDIAGFGTLIVAYITGLVLAWRRLKHFD